MGVRMAHNATPLMQWQLGLLEYATGELERAEALMSEALPAARASNYASFTVTALLITAAAQLARGETAPAVAAIEEAVLVARESGNPLAIGAALEAQAQLAREAGEISAAEELLHEALRAFHEAGDPGGVADVLESLAALVAELQNAEQAVRLLGAADGIRAAVGCVRFPVRQPSYEAELGALREALGEEAFAAAWSAGASASLDDAVAYAERGRGRTQAAVARLGEPEPGRAASRAARRRGPDQPSDRRAPVHLAPYRPSSPVPRVRQARRLIARRARSASGAERALADAGCRPGSRSRPEASRDLYPAPGLTDPQRT